MKSGDTFAQVIQLRRERDAAKAKLQERFMQNLPATVAWYNAEDARIDKEYQRKLRKLQQG